MSNQCRDLMSDYLLECEEEEKEFESDFEKFCYELSDRDVDILLDRQERARDMAAELGTKVK